jgi:hypothetical protein
MANDDHKLAQVSSHVTSLGGRVGVVGLCSCGWLGGEEGDDTKGAIRKLYKAWEAHEPAGSLRWMPSADAAVQRAGRRQASTA